MNELNELNISITTTTNGFWWNGMWHEVRPSAGDDDGPPAGVREPRRPRPTAPATAAAVEPPELELTDA